MKKSRFLDTQITTILKQAESGTPIPKLCGEHGISKVTFYNWRRKSRNTSTAPITPPRQDENESQKIAADRP
jgi:putative transposase